MHRHQTKVTGIMNINKTWPYKKKVIKPYLFQFSSVQSLSHVWLFATPWIAACQASLSITNFWSLLKLMSIELVMASNHLICCCPLLLLTSIFPSIRVFPVSVGVSASASVLPLNIQDGFPLGWTDWISLQSKGLSRVFSNTTIQKHQFLSLVAQSVKNLPAVQETWVWSLG